MPGFPQLLRLVLLAPLLAATVGAEPDATAPPRREHVISPRLASVLASTLPKYDASVPGAGPGGPARPTIREQPRNGIIRLPDYIVREPRLPDEYDVLTEKGRGAIAVRRYLGQADGFDRGYLNAFTLDGLWEKIPLLGRLPFVPFGSVSNEQRVLEIYERVERKRRLQELFGLEALAASAEKPDRPPAPPPKP